MADTSGRMALVLSSAIYYLNIKYELGSDWKRLAEYAGFKFLGTEQIKGYVATLSCYTCLKSKCLLNGLDLQILFRKENQTMIDKSYGKLYTTAMDAEGDTML